MSSINHEYENLIACLRLARTASIGPVTFSKLINKYKSPITALDNCKDFLSKKEIEVTSRELAEKEIDDTEKFGGKIVSKLDEKYPAQLKEIYAAPIIISYIGAIEKIKTNNIAFVGTRNASTNGIVFANRLAQDVAEKNYCVVSGLAKGIDTSSHKGALQTSKEDIATIAVLGGGIDNIYPKENEKLFAEIAERGVIISENQINVSPKAENFPKRNRIISGLSDAVIIIEAALKSGSLITARYAIEQNREIMCVPGFPADKRSEGTNKLIQQGANLITSSKDVFELLNNNNLKIRNNIELNFKEVEEDFISEKVGTENNKILDFIGSHPVSIDDLARTSGMKISAINAQIFEHEILGEVERIAGNKVIKISG